MFFITGMMGPYMSPMALNVPVAMLMSMLVAFTITPWLTYHILTWRTKLIEAGSGSLGEPESNEYESKIEEAYDVEEVRRTFMYRVFRPLMTQLLKSRFHAIVFLAFMALLTAGAMGLGLLRMVPLKLLPFDNKK